MNYDVALQTTMYNYAPFGLDLVSNLSFECDICVQFCFDESNLRVRLASHIFQLLIFEEL